MSQTIRQQTFYPHPPETVWAYLTTPELMSQWLMPTDFEPVLGHSFRFTTKPITQLNLDGIMHCKVLEIIPFSRLSYSWKAGPGDGSFTLDTIVEWTLVEKNNGTELQLIQTGFDENTNAGIYAGMSDGWPKHLQKIANHLTANT